METQLRCYPCNAPRKGISCHKCGGPLETPHPGWLEPKLSDVSVIRALAKQMGYAITEHGSKERDLDLVAIPWTEHAVTAAALVDYLVEQMGMRLISTEKKPLGRIAVSLQQNGWYKLIDLSITPAVV